MATGARGDKIAIVMATYNGALYLSEQIDSILAQDHGNWRLIVRDDGSTDGTADILRAYAARHEEKISLVTDDLGNLGPTANFSRLLEIVDAPYVALCDQDDVWLPDKLSKSLARMQALEAIHGTDTPTSVFTDLVVVDRGLNTISESFWSYQTIDPATADRLSRVLVTNVATGCTMLINESLLRLVRPIPPAAYMHDWWIALCACAVGHLVPVREPLVKYRKHERNIIGPRRQILRAFDYLRYFRRNRRRLMQIFEQAAALRNKLEVDLSHHQGRLLDNFVSLPKLSFVCRLIALRKHNYYYNLNPIYLLGLALLTGSRRLNFGSNCGLSKNSRAELN